MRSLTRAGVLPTIHIRWLGGAGRAAISNPGQVEQ